MDLFNYLIPDAKPVFIFSDSEENVQQQSDISKKMGFTPDIVTTLKIDGLERRMYHRVHLLNILGYIPIVSTVSGSYRTLVGTAYLVKSIACHMFETKEKEKHQEGMRIAKANIYRGLVEMIPLVGNIIVGVKDINRMESRWSMDC